MIYVNCPLCGHKLMEGEAGSVVQIKCNKCARILNAVITPHEVKIRIKEKLSDVRES